ncbi:MAG: LysR substrate-binding domain-containing protein, partial [Thermodesulfobacteriota bacterium]
MQKGLNNLGIGINDLNIQAVVNSTESVLKCIQAGLGVSITSRLAAGDLLFREDIELSQVRDMNLERYFYAVYHRQREFFPATKHFWDLLTSRTAEML